MFPEKLVYDNLHDDPLLLCGLDGPRELLPTKDMQAFLSSLHQNAPCTGNPQRTGRSRLATTPHGEVMTSLHGQRPIIRLSICHQVGGAPRVRNQGEKLLLQEGKACNR